MQENESQTTALSKSELILQFRKERRIFLGRLRRGVFDSDAREDIFQEACLRFLASKASFHCPQAAAKYLQLILRSLAVDHLKDRARLKFCAHLPESVCEVQAEWHTRMLIDRLRQESQRLSPTDRQLLATLLDPHQTCLRDRCRSMNLPSST